MTRALLSYLARLNVRFTLGAPLDATGLSSFNSSPDIFTVRFCSIPFQFQFRSN
jgi:hypothetical protein